MDSGVNKTYKENGYIIEVVIYDNTYRKIGYYKTDENNFYKILKMIYKKFGIVTIKPKTNKELSWLDTPNTW